MLGSFSGLAVFITVKAIGASVQGQRRCAVFTGILFEKYLCKAL
jgi:hypothetical protein